MNDRLAGYVDEQLADAKAQIDDAKSQLNSAKSQLESSQKALQDQQSSTASELAQTSKAVDAAVATQSAYNAQLAGLQASKTGTGNREKKRIPMPGLRHSMSRSTKALRLFEIWHPVMAWMLLPIRQIFRML